MSEAEQFKVLVELYKAYLDIAIQSAILAGAVIGGIYSYQVKHQIFDNLLCKLPTVFSILFAVIYVIVFYPSILHAMEIYRLGNAIHFPLIPHVWLLPAVVGLFLIIFTTASVYFQFSTKHPSGLNHRKTNKANIKLFCTNKPATPTELSPKKLSHSASKKLGCL